MSSCTDYASLAGMSTRPPIVDDCCGVESDLSGPWLDPRLRKGMKTTENKRRDGTAGGFLAALKWGLFGGPFALCVGLLAAGCGILFH